VGGSALRALRERIQPPLGIPMWVYFGATGFAAAIITWSMLQGGSWLPLVVQIPLAIATFLPWCPGLRNKIVSPSFFVLSTIPTLLLTWTGGSVFLFGLLALSASRVSVSSPIPRIAAYSLGAIAIVVGREFIAHQSTDWWMWKTYVELGAVVGFALQRQRLIVVQTREESSEHARLAALDERKRIADDVHDVLAHSLTILMVHVNSARLQILDDPEGTREILDEVARYGRQCLEEIRQSVGLRSETRRAEPTGGPVETANAIERLVCSYRDAGIDVDLQLDVDMAHMGLLASAPTAIWAAGYRIAQESLANAAKHGTGADVELWIGVDDAGLHMTCTNLINSDVVPLELPKGGNGLAAMRDRVTNAGGSFFAGLESRRWVVRVDLPLVMTEASGRPASLGRAS
jgi:signal transduction histidine kinase